MRKPIRKQGGVSHSDSVLIYGRHAVLAALQNRQRRIDSLMATDEAMKWLDSTLCAQHNITPKIAPRTKLEESLPPQDKHIHQGLVMRAARLDAPNLDDWLAQNASAPATLLMLDQITDARNIGAMMRSAWAFGAHALIATDRHTPQETGTMLRAASGAAEHLPLIRVVNLSRAITQLQQHGFLVAGLDAAGEYDIASLGEEQHRAIVLGAEGKGLRRLTREKIDRLVHIPMQAGVESLNVSTAAAIALYANYRGR